MKHRPILALALAVALSAALASDWPQFRGPQRDGCSPETGLMRAWPESGPREAWRKKIGPGYSGVSVVNGRLYTMYAEGDGDDAKEYAFALDLADGKQIWRTEVGKRYDEQFGKGPRATPTVDGDTVYVLGSLGTLKALAASDGAERWKLELTEAFGAQVPQWGFSVSAIVDGGKVILEGGGPQGKSYAGIDAKTGKVLWTSGDGPEQPGYMSPLVVDIGGRHQYIGAVGTTIRSLDASGKLLWSHPWPRGETHATPVFIPPDRVLVSGVEGIGAVLLQIENGKDEAAVKELWKNPTFRTHFNAAVLQGEHLYGFDNTTLKCISAKDGSVAWAKRGLGKGSVIAADGLLFVLSDDGVLALVEATPSAYTEKGRIQALKPEDGRAWTPPTLSGGRVYVRNHAELVAYDVKG